MVKGLDVFRKHFAALSDQYVLIGGTAATLAMNDIRKHANDVIRLSQLLTPDSRVPIATRIAEELQRFLDGIVADGSYDPKSIQIDLQVSEVIDRVRGAYESGGLGPDTSEQPPSRSM